MMTLNKVTLTFEMMNTFLSEDTIEEMATFEMITTVIMITTIEKINIIGIIKKKG